MKRLFIITLIILSMLLFPACAGKTGTEDIRQPEQPVEAEKIISEASSDPAAESSDETEPEVSPEPSPEPALTPEPGQPEESPSEPVTLRVGSFNINHGRYVDNDYSVLAADISALGLDIVGLQEVDEFTRRNGNRDTMKEIAEAAGFAYYEFSPAISYEGGKYGTGILSRYPIVSYVTVPLESGRLEQRSFGFAVIDVGGTEICFINTHLSFEKEDVNKSQFSALAQVAAWSGRYYLVTGDFNTLDFSLYDLFTGASCVNTALYPLQTFEGSSPIDNIVCSEGFEILESGAYSFVNHSDHSLIWAQLRLAG